MPISAEELQALKVLHPNLQLKAPYKELTIGGSIHVDHIHNDFHVNEMFDIDIKIPLDYPYSIPKVFETGNKVAKSYPHIYSNGMLCLGIDGEIMFGCNGIMNLGYLLSIYLIPYFFSYRYFERFNNYPFGQRAHGGQGILDSYIEKFSLLDYKTVVNFLQMAVMNRYSGHSLCPCNSGKKVRDCHSNILKRINDSAAIKQAIINDLKTIKQEVLNT